MPDSSPQDRAREYHRPEKFLESTHIKLTAIVDRSLVVSRVIVVRATVVTNSSAAFPCQVKPFGEDEEEAGDPDTLKGFLACSMVL